MLKRILVISVMLGLLLVVSCTPSTPPQITQAPEEIPLITVSPTTPITPTVAKTVPLNQEPAGDIEVRLMNQTWVSPAEVKIGNFYPGARAEWNIRIHNGNDAKTKFFVSYMVSNTTREGYALAPPEAKDWIIIEDSTPVLAPKETREILVVLSIPKDTVVLDKQWEFWTVAGEVSTWAVQTQMATRWCVSMR